MRSRKNIFFGRFLRCIASTGQVDVIVIISEAWTLNPSFDATLPLTDPVSEHPRSVTTRAHCRVRAHWQQVYQRAVPAALTHRDVPRCYGRRLASPPLATGVMTGVRRLLPATCAAAARPVITPISPSNSASSWTWGLAIPMNPVARGGRNGVQCTAQDRLWTLGPRLGTGTGPGPALGIPGILQAHEP